MAGAQALVAYKDSKGSMTVSTYNISSYESIVKSKKLSFDVWDTRADESGGMMRIFGKIKVPKELATAGKINQIWQVGPSVSGDGLLAKHQFVPANLNAKGSLDLGGATNSGVGTDSRIKKRNVRFYFEFLVSYFLVSPWRTKINLIFLIHMELLFF